MFYFQQEIERTGIRPKTDPRFKAIIIQLNKFKAKTSASLESLTLTFDQFRSVIELNLPFIVKVFRNDLVLPEFDQFCDQVRVLYNDLKKNNDGSVSKTRPLKGTFIWGNEKNQTGVGVYIYIVLMCRLTACCIHSSIGTSIKR